MTFCYATPCCQFQGSNSKLQMNSHCSLLTVVIYFQWYPVGFSNEWQERQGVPEIRATGCTRDKSDSVLWWYPVPDSGMGLNRVLSF
jgi:hypothetical protein